MDVEDRAVCIFSFSFLCFRTSLTYFLLFLGEGSAVFLDGSEIDFLKNVLRDSTKVASHSNRSDDPTYHGTK